MNMLPEALQLAMKPHLAITTYESFEKELIDHIAFLEQTKNRKAIRAITVNEEEECKKCGQEECYDESGMKWLSVAVPGEEEGKKRKVDDVKR